MGALGLARRDAGGGVMSRVRPSLRIDLVQGGLGAGGAEKVVNALARHWSTAGHEVRVLALGGDAASYFPYPPEVEVHARTGRNSGGRARDRLDSFAWLRRRLRERPADAAVSFLTKVNVLAAAAIGAETALVISERNNPVVQTAHPVWRVGTRVVLRRADAVVMQTEAARATLPPARRPAAAVIPNPCVLPALARRDRSASPDFIAVGRLDRQKGFDLLIEAFARHAAAGGAGTLTIFGEGPERAALQAQVRESGLVGRIDLPGATPEPGGWLSGTGIFVLSSRHEGFPNVLVEALGAGFPVIAADCPWGPGDLIEDRRNGMLVPPGDPATLAQAMTRLSADPGLRRALAARAPGSVAHLDPNTVLRRWDAVLMDALARRSQRGAVRNQSLTDGASLARR